MNEHETPERVDETVDPERLVDGDVEAAGKPVEPEEPVAGEAVQESSPSGMTIDELKHRFWALIDEAKAGGIAAPLRELGISMGSRLLSAAEGLFAGWNDRDRKR